MGDASKKQVSSNASTDGISRVIRWFREDRSEGLWSPELSAAVADILERATGGSGPHGGRTPAETRLWEDGYRTGWRELKTIRKPDPRTSEASPEGPE